MTLLALLILTLILISVILFLRTIINWYAKKIAPTKPNQALILNTLIKPLVLTLILFSVGLLVFIVLTPSHNTVYQIIATLILFSWTISSLVIVKRLIHLTIHNLSKRYQHHLYDAAPMLTSFMNTAIVFISLYLLFLIWDFNITPLIATLSIVGAALSFAARDAVGNTISGISIFITQPFKVGDYIVVDSSFQGTIQEIGAQQTKLLSPANTILIIPNSTIITRPVENQTAVKSYVKFTLPLSFAVTDNLDLIKKTLIATATENVWLLKKPQPRIRYLNLTQAAINLELTAALKDQTKHALVTHQLLHALVKNTPKSNPS